MMHEKEKDCEEDSKPVSKISREKLSNRWKIKKELKKDQACREYIRNNERRAGERYPLQVLK